MADKYSLTLLNLIQSAAAVKVIILFIPFDKTLLLS